ncbi:MAG: DUF998 domain-containing protein [Acholeplasmataceae bacterium]|nr:DUF998 domain-containing protein [Acholeplasmataceae bacterium]
MSKYNLIRTASIVILIAGILSIIFYFLHVILGSMFYPGYNPLTQAVSDLTSDGSPARSIARTYSSLYGITSSIVSIGLLYVFRSEQNKLLKIGIYLLSIMYLTSAIGYSLFPLSSNENIVTFQDVMHIVVTIIVVLLTIAALIVLILAFKKANRNLYFIITIIVFIFLMLGAILTNLVSPNYFGIAERLSVFSIVIYVGIISCFNYGHHHIKE